MKPGLSAPKFRGNLRVTVDERLRLRNPHEHHFISILCSANDVE